MKQIFLILVVASTLLMGACGGGGSNDTPENLPVDDQETQGFPVDVPADDQETPSFPVDVPVDDQETPSNPVDVPVDSNTSVDAGALTDLFGRVVFVYNFEGSEALFSAAVNFDEEDLIESDSGSVMLFDVGSTGARLTTDAEIVNGRDMFVSCSFFDSINQFFCVLDPAGVNKSLFQFDRPANGEVFGSFEFCGEADDAACVNELISTPDGIVGVFLSGDVVTKVEPESQSDTSLPYLQYFEQGSASLDGSGIARKSSSGLDAMVKVLEQLESLDIDD